MSRSRFLTLFVIVFAVMCMSAAAFGQSLTGSITGIVKDPNGAVIPGVRVVARNAGTNAAIPAVTDDAGYYRLPNLVSGSYVIEVEARGFRKFVTAPQRLSTGDQLRVDAKLEIGEVTEIVTVEDVSTQVNTEDAQLGKALRDIPQLPILSGAGGRNPLALAVTQAGVSSYNPISSQPGSFSVNGQRVQANNYLLDGGDSNDQAINVPDSVENISPNALAEFRIVTGAMKAEYGRNMGSIVEVTTKSGTNALHATLSETLRNTKLNAVPFFSKSTSGGTPETYANGFPRKPQWNSNDFDVSVGGPVLRDRLFVQGTYLGFRRRQGVTSSATVFTDAERDLISQNGTVAAQNLLALVPRASQGNTLFSSPSNSRNRDQGVLKLDYLVSQANHLSVTYFKENSTQMDPFAFGGSAIPGFGQIGQIGFQNAIARDTHTFSAALFNEFRAAFHRRAAPGVSPINSTSPAQLGLKGIIPDDPGAAGPPYVEFFNSGIAWGNTYQGPQSRYDNTFQYIDNLSWTRGRHYLKFGGEFRTFAQNQVFDFLNNGYIGLDGSGVDQGLVKEIPGLAADMSDFAGGFSGDFEQSNSGRQGYRSRSVNLFAQDDWKITSHFTVNLGLRWELNKGYTELHDQVATIRPGQQSTVFPTAPVGLVYSGDTGIARSTYGEDYNNFAPRVGFAWDVFKNGRLSVRGGYGIFYDAPYSELTLQFLGVPPYGIQTVLLGTTDYTNPYPNSVANPTANPFPFKPTPRGGKYDFTQIAPIHITRMDQNFRTPHGQMFNLSTQWQLHRSWVLDVGYVGSTGANLLDRKELNYAIPGPGATTGNTDARRILNQNNPQNQEYGGAVFGGITNQLTDASSRYDSLQVSATRRFSSGFSTTQAYTWAHGLDNASGLRVNTRPDSTTADRGNSETDMRHRYVATYIYELPFFKDQKGAVGRVLGGWGVSGVTTFQTGLPFNITESSDRALNGGVGGQRPDYAGGTLAFFDPRNTNAVAGKLNAYFDGTGGGTSTAATNPFFRRVGSGTTWALGAGRYGNLGRNVFHGPGLNNFDLAAFKRVRLYEAHEVEFRAESFNAFNHTQFGQPNGSIGSASFGRITSAASPRVMQLSLRYQF
jgi:hypothetical protein